MNNLKDPVETKLHTAVCSCKVTLVLEAVVWERGGIRACRFPP
ncbi:hypothetical protein ACIOHS_02905 [Streptomyces sp. NPDC088253]